MGTFYSNDLSYRQVHQMKITNRHLQRYFVNPKTGDEISEKKPRISIRWYTHPYLLDHFWE